jgi:hypothetical protein
MEVKPASMKGLLVGVQESPQILCCYLIQFREWIDDTFVFDIHEFIEGFH